MPAVSTNPARRSNDAPSAALREMENIEKPPASCRAQAARPARRFPHPEWIRTLSAAGGQGRGGGVSVASNHCRTGEATVTGAKLRLCGAPAGVTGGAEIAVATQAPAQRPETFSPCPEEVPCVCAMLAGLQCACARSGAEKAKVKAATRLRASRKRERRRVLTTKL